MDQKLIKLWLLIAIILGFASAIFFSLTYLSNNVICTLECRQKNEVQLVLIMLSLMGLFVGSLTYYFISEKYLKKINKIHRDMESVYNFLDPEQRKIIKTLVEGNGEIAQSKLAKKTKLSRVKISRELKKLEDKKIIIKKSNGMTNSIELSEDIQKLFIEKHNSDE